MTQWHEANPELFEEHKHQAAQHLSDVRCEFDAGRNLHIIGTLSILQKSGYPLDSVRLRFVYPENLGQSGAAIQVFDEEKRFTPDPECHVNSDSSFCWGIPGEAGIEFGRSNALSLFLTALRIFFTHQWVYQRRKQKERLGGPKAKWPGVMRPHGIEGLRDAVQSRGGLGPNDPCLCGSGKEYKSCHLEQIGRTIGEQ